MSDNQKILLVRGLPGSGKSTWAAKWVEEDPQNRFRVNRDDIRFELFGMYYLKADAHGTTQEKEAHVTHIQNNLTEKALREGKSVVIDNTNLDPRVFKTFGDIAKRHNVDMVNKDFPVDIEECIRRNNARDRVVPEHAIRAMQKNYMGPNGEFHMFPNTYPTKAFKAPTVRREAVLFDMDGTLADVSQIRERFMIGKYRNFDAFHRNSLWVPPHEEVLQMAYDADNAGYSIVISTARNEAYREVTQAWLDKNNVNYENIYMRKDGDFRPDYQAKKDIHADITKHYDIVHAVDDRKEVIQLWQENGIYTTVVDNFEDTPLELRKPVTIKNPFRTNKCIRCGKTIKGEGFIGPECAKK